MKRPPGRRPAEPRNWLYELRYQADSWDKPRRVILVVKDRADDLLPDRFFLVTSLGWTAKTRGEGLAHDRERSKAEGLMGELKDVLAPAFLDQPGDVALAGQDANVGEAGRGCIRLQRGPANCRLPHLSGHAYRPPGYGKGDRHRLQLAPPARAGAPGQCFGPVLRASASGQCFGRCFGPVRGW